jgi:hypothetical protein
VVQAVVTEPKPPSPSSVEPLVVSNRRGLRLEIHSREQAVWAGQLLAQLEGAGPC